MKYKKALLYSHGGSANHGCEAIVRSSIKVMEGFDRFKLLSKNPEEDYLYQLDKITQIESSDDDIKRNKLRYFIYLLKMKFLKSDSIYFQELYRNITKKADGFKIAFSIGGDNYCYKGFNEELKVLNEKFNAKGIKTVLWGCSIEPANLTKETVKDLSLYSLITARESITYNALLEKGLKNARLYPDPAFQLDRVDLPLPDGFVEGNTVGINVSPLIIKSEKNKGVTISNYIKLVEYIIEKTSMQIALVPHVVWSHNDDREPLHLLFKHFEYTNRIILIQDYNAMELKGFIARCRFFVAARTHASIAAYSQEVPTLVVGYSVKARGIAQDIFGTDKGYVIPVQSLVEEDDLVTAFQFIQDSEADIKAHYQKMMGTYKLKSLDAIKEVYNL